jgi:uncharacterized protein (DUF1778 family)
MFSNDLSRGEYGMPDSSKSRERNINVRASADEYRRIQQGAERHGLSLSEFLRVLGSSEQWAIDQQQSLRDWQAMLTRLEQTPAPIWTTITQEARERAELIESILIVAQRMEDTAAQLRRMLSPAVEEMQTLLERLAQASAAVIEAPRAEARKD